MTVRLWDQGGKLLHNLASKHNDRVRSVGVSANGDHLYAIFTNRMISVWETQTGQLVDTIGPIETDGSYRIDYQLNWPAAIILHERRVVCGSYSGRIYMWRGDKLCFEAAGHDDPVYAIAFSPGGEFFASSSESGEVILWDASSGERLLEPLTGHSGQVRIVTFSPDGSVFASGSGDTTVRLWSSDTGLMVGDPLRGHTGEVFSVAFSCAGRQLVSGSADMTVRMWDVATGMSKAVYRGHTDLVLSVSLSPDATQIVTGSADMTIRLSNIPGPTTGASSSSPCDVSSESLSGSPANIAHDISTREWEMDEDGWHSIVAAKLEADIAARLY
ncbi:unnamed protein product [Rhizoctonia solani]|uniref:Vegetative incompatibility protein HET-E-1 [Podospora anserina] n=1 Tax=Rhizoctonia solani TaxID=456999 RepID=A0A8H3DWF7_9AGAM|nr:unnamed protein product [Rhizoctonia solani]